MSKEFNIKINAGVIALIVILLGCVVGTVSSDIYLSDSRNDYYTMITTSQGGVYEPIQSNIQVAINSLAPNGGTVWVPESVTTWGSLSVPANVNLIGWGNQTLNCGTTSITAES